MLPLILIIAVLALGIVFCFNGCRCLKIIIAIYVFVTGFLFVYNLISDYAPNVSAWIPALIAGLVLALLSAFFVMFAVFITGGVAGLLIYSALLRSFPFIFAGTEISSLLYCVLFFAVMGILALIVKKHLIIFFTAFIGAETIVQAGGMLIGVIMNPNILNRVDLSSAVTVFKHNSVFTDLSAISYILPIIIFMIAGVWTQYRHTAGGVKPQ